jgi:hypothetical protein
MGASLEEVAGADQAASSSRGCGAALVRRSKLHEFAEVRESCEVRHRSGLLASEGLTAPEVLSRR